LKSLSATFLSFYLSTCVSSLVCEFTCLLARATYARLHSSFEDLIDSRRRRPLHPRCSAHACLLPSINDNGTDSYRIISGIVPSTCVFYVPVIARYLVPSVKEIVEEVLSFLMNDDGPEGSGLQLSYQCTPFCGFDV